jgi:hypothetical protein
MSRQQKNLFFSASRARRMKPGGMTRPEFAIRLWARSLPALLAQSNAAGCLSLQQQVIPGKIIE